MLPRLHVAHLLSSCRVLGPGHRGVLWVRGCQRRCRGCIAEPILGPPADSGTAVDELGARILAWPGIEGVTFSGGEPFEQAAALLALCQFLRSQRDMSLMCYSGFTLKELRSHPDVDVQGLLALLDILVDGPFVQAQQHDLLWRGSTNQQIHLLSDRHRELTGSLDGPGAGMELHVSRRMGLFWAGVPEPGFQAGLGAGLRSHGISLTDKEGVWS